MGNFAENLSLGNRVRPPLRTQIPVDNFACLSKPTLALVVLQLRCCLNMTFLTFGPQL